MPTDPTANPTTNTTTDTTNTTTESKPNHSTLYINNIKDSVSKQKLLYVLKHLFGQHGSVAEVHVRKSLKMKGQAFVTYKDTASCERAILKLQGRPMFKKPMHISYAKTSSDAFLTLQGATEELQARRQERAKHAKKEETRKQEDKSLPKVPVLSEAQLKRWILLPPHRVLLLQNLPDDKLDSEPLEKAFGEFAGYEKVRLIKFRKLAFVDFELEAQATLCLQQLDKTIFGPKTLLTYAKK